MRKSATSYDQKSRMSPDQCNAEERVLIGRKWCNFRKYWPRRPMGPRRDRPDHRTHRTPRRSQGFIIFGAYSPIASPPLYLRRVSRILTRPRKSGAEQLEEADRAVDAARLGRPNPSTHIAGRLYNIIGRVAINIERRARRAGPILYAHPRQSAHIPYAARITRPGRAANFRPPSWGFGDYAPIRTRVVSGRPPVISLPPDREGGG